MDKVMLLVMVLAVTAVSVIGQAEASQRPHIVLIVADDLGYNDVSFHGSNQIPTPNIDRLAYTGVLLNNYYVSPICTPTRSALMTGRHPIHTGMQTGVIFGDQPYGLPLTEKLLPQYLNPLGYRSHMVGKWHLGMFAKEYTPLYRGFESHFGYYQGCEDYYDHSYEANPSQWGLDFWRDTTVMRNYTGHYSTTLFTNEAVSIIGAHDASEPLFLYLPYQAVHSGNADSPTPLEAPQSYIDRFPHIQNKQRRVYAGMVSALDDGVGAVYAALKKKNMSENTIIVFTTDNGGPANGFDYNAANNFPLRGLKATLWEGGVRGVGFLHSPLLKKQGYVAEQMLHVCDWLPTLYEAAGGEPSALKNLDGVSAWKTLSTDGAPVRSEILHNIDPINRFAGIRVGEFKLVTGNIGNGHNGWYPQWRLDGDEWRLHVDRFRSNDATVSAAASASSSSSSSSFSSHSSSPSHPPPPPSPLPLRSNRHHHQLQQEHHRRLSLEEALRGSLSDSHLKETTYRAKDGAILMGMKNSDSMESSSYLKEMSYHGISSTDATKNSESTSSSLFASSGPVRVDCGRKPANASTNCRPEKAPCLFHIPSDPCEYNNIAAGNADIVAALFRRLTEYMYTMVPPGNKPCDDWGNPKYHNNTWVPWVTL